MRSPCCARARSVWCGCCCAGPWTAGPAGAVAAVDDYTVLLAVLLFFIALIVWFAFCACLSWLLRVALPRVQGVGHAAADRARVLGDICRDIAEHLHTTPGVWSDEPDSYAATAAARRSHRKTDTTGGPR